MTEPPPTEPKGRVLLFKPRGGLFARHVPQPSPVEDLGKFEHTNDAPGDYRHRMTMNGLALLVTILLVVAGIWIADTMATMRKNQDCVLSGRRGCTPVDVPILPR